jgi:2-methylcitrate synthase
MYMRSSEKTALQTPNQSEQHSWRTTMAEKKLSGAGLRGQVAGETALCTVGKTGTGLTYRGYDISELAENAKFEEVAHLLLKGHLPKQQELDAYTNKIKSLRDLPQALKDVLERIPASAHPMDVMRTGCSMLGNLETETDFSQQDDAIDRLLAALPSIICYWYVFSHEGKRIETALDDESIGAHFLHMLSGETPSELFSQVMNVSLILYAEHEFNASTFTARVCASTLSDMHSCITAAIGSLRGPLHGGANEAAMDMIENWTSADQAEQEIMGMLARKDKIMGFGHAIYSESDPRNTIIKLWAEKLAAEVGDTTLYPVSVRCEEVMWREKKLFCNADFFHASAYHFMGIPTKLFTPIFVMSRLTGWAAHVKEQRSNNRIIRPSADYTGPETSKWVDIADR